MSEFQERRTYESVVTQMARLEERILAANEALRLARDEIDRRLEGMNELRDQIARERGDYLSRQEYASEYKALITELASIQKFMWMIAGGLAIVEVGLHFWYGG
jgi:hypothetical protein